SQIISACSTYTHRGIVGSGMVQGRVTPALAQHSARSPYAQIRSAGIVPWALKTDNELRPCSRHDTCHGEVAADQATFAFARCSEEERVGQALSLFVAEVPAADRNGSWREVLVGELPGRSLLCQGSTQHGWLRTPRVPSLRRIPSELGPE